MRARRFLFPCVALATMVAFSHAGAQSTAALVSQRFDDPARTSDGSRSMRPTLSADGGTIAYISDATNLVDGLAEQAAGDIVSDRRIYLFDVESSSNHLLPIQSGPQDGLTSISTIIGLRISGDASCLVFKSRFAQGQNEGKGIFLVDATLPVTGPREIRIVKLIEGGTHGIPSVDHACRYVAFRAGSGIEVHDLDGSAPPLALDDASANYSKPFLSGNANHLVFVGRAGGLDQVYLYDLGGKIENPANDVTPQAVAGFPAGSVTPGFNEHPTVSDDGRFVTTSIVPQGESRVQSYLVDREVAGGTSRLLSRTQAGAAGGHHSYHTAVTTDGKFAMFVSRATDLDADFSAHAAYHEQYGSFPDFRFFLHDVEQDTNTFVGVEKKSGDIGDDTERNLFGVRSSGSSLHYVFNQELALDSDRNVPRLTGVTDTNGVFDVVRGQIVFDDDSPPPDPPTDLQVD